MVNGNYIFNGDRPSSESEIVEDHVHTRTVDRKNKRKSNRTANELQQTLNQAQLDNETDSIKYEKRTKEPKLLRYVSSKEVEQNFITDKLDETYDFKSRIETPRRHTFAKKPKNPTDGSPNYVYSRSSSSCSSPTGNLPTISEHVENYGTYRPRAPPSPSVSDIINDYESKFDKYFAKPTEVKKFAAKGSHPDSLYRVVTNSGAGAGKLTRTMRLLRWPIALITVCVALAVFVYFLMPDNLEPAMKLDVMNGTYWESAFAETQTPAQEKLGQSPTTTSPISSSTGTRRTLTHGTKTQEIDFYEAANDKNADLTPVVGDTIAESVPKRILPIQPVYPSHIAPEVQYGDSEKMRTPKLLDETNAVPDDSTLKPHITQKPETPLAIYFKEADAITTTSTESITRAETLNDFTNYGGKQTTKKVVQAAPKPYPIAYKELSSLLVRPVVKDSQNIKQQIVEPDFLPDIHEFYSRVPTVNTNVNFTSGHSKLFGISIEDAERMKSTTQSSIYNTRVSPTLPTWRDGDDTTTKKYPVNVTADVPQCRSTRLHFCRGILPYDLAGAAETVAGVDVTSLFPQIEFLVTRNCNARLKYFMCALLEPECNPPPYKRKLPCYSLCKAIMDSCEGQIPRELAPIFKCDEYSKDNCLGAKAPCFPRELPCGDGSCVPRDWMCDGTLDCPGGEDEAPCAQCDKNEFTCPSGGCVLKRWVCDGYSDCPSGEDEDPARCETAAAAAGSKEIGEESAGSAPAPSVKRPNRVPTTNSHRNAGETDSSQELLVTSDSGNAFKRNFTRRPSLSRLSPYNRPMLHQKSRHNKPEVIEPKNRQTIRKLPVEKTKETEKKETSDEDVMEDLGLFEDTQKVNKEQKHVEEPSQKQNIPLEYRNRAPLPSPLDKSIKNLERVIDGSSLLQKAANRDTEATATKEEDSPETKGTAVDDEPEPSIPSPVPISLTGGASTSSPVAKSVPGSYTAHASPCPAGELRCVDGRCITLAQLCDGTIDCSDHADEDNCYT